MVLESRIIRDKKYINDMPKRSLGDITFETDSEWVNEEVEILGFQLLCL